MPNLAKNPVAKAVTQDMLRKALRDQKIALYLTATGDECSELMSSAGTTLAFIGFAFEWQHRHDSEDERNTPELRVLRGGLSACDQLLTSGKYDAAYTVAIANALDAGEKLMRKIERESIVRTWELLFTKKTNAERVSE